MILLTGGTGLLGRRVLEGLVAKQYPVRVFTRGASDWSGNVLAAIKRIGAEPFLGDLRDEFRVGKALEGCNVVVNLAGIKRSTSQENFQEIHVQAVQDLIAMSEKLGIQRFVHVSCLGESPRGDSEYFASKAEGEALVKKAEGFHWTIFRPSFMFGERFLLADLLLPMVKSLPVVPVIGGGLNQVQPIWVDDVATCVIESIYDKQTAQKSYDLVGPKAYSLSEIIQLLCATLGKRKPLMNLPSEATFKFIKLIEKLYPKGDINEDLVKLLLAEKKVNNQEMQEKFPVRMTSLEENLQQMIAAQ